MTTVEPPGEETEPIAVQRNLLGRSAAFWASRGEHEVEPGWWKAMSGARCVDLNALVCHGDDPGLVRRSLDAVGATKTPATITLAGPALDGAQILNDGGWVCIGAGPFMVLKDLGNLVFDPGHDVSKVGPAQLPGVWEAVQEAFQFTPELARVAIPEDVPETPGHSVWTLSVNGHVRSCVVMVKIERSVMVWFMATPPAWQGHGYGRRLLSAALAHSAAEGVTQSILLASPAGERMYRSFGYEIAEYWQAWSRPRWVFGRS